jgi:hypothetical protein
MARSLTVAQEENPRTSLLLTGFLLLAVGWLALSAFAGFGADAAATPPVEGATSAAE